MHAICVCGMQPLLVLGGTDGGVGPRTLLVLGAGWVAARGPGSLLVLRGRAEACVLEPPLVLWGRGEGLAELAGFRSGSMCPCSS